MYKNCMKQSSHNVRTKAMKSDTITAFVRLIILDIKAFGFEVYSESESLENYLHNRSQIKKLFDTAILV